MLDVRQGLALSCYFYGNVSNQNVLIYSQQSRPVGLAAGITMIVWISVGALGITSGARAYPNGKLHQLRVNQIKTLQ